MLFSKKIKNVLFVVIRFTEGYDINELFEGLNSKGKILSTVQLTKNALFGGKQDELNSESIIKIWEDIEKNFEKHNVIWFDKFLKGIVVFINMAMFLVKLYLKILRPVK